MPEITPDLTARELVMDALHERLPDTAFGHRADLSLWNDRDVMTARILAALGINGDGAPEARFGVVLDRPDSQRFTAWAFTDALTAAKFAEFVTAEIDPARVLPWAGSQPMPGVRTADPVAELLAWRESVAQLTTSRLQRIAEAHQQHVDEHGGTSGYCTECDHAWPCPTWSWAATDRDALACWDPADDEPECYCPDGDDCHQVGCPQFAPGTEAAR